MIPAADDEHVQPLLGLYVLGRLPDEELFLVDEHLALCALCRVDFIKVNEARAILDKLRPHEAVAIADEFSPPQRRRVGTDPVPRPSTPRPPRYGAARPAPSKQRRRDSAIGRRPFTLVLSLVMGALAIGIGVGAWLISGTAVAITLAGSETNSATGVSLSVSVVERDGGSHVDASVTGLNKGREYQLYAVDVRGGTVVVTRWVASEDGHTVTGQVALATKDLAFFSVVEEGGGVVVTVRVAKSAR